MGEVVIPAEHSNGNRRWRLAVLAVGIGFAMVAAAVCGGSGATVQEVGSSTPRSKSTGIGGGALGAAAADVQFDSEPSTTEAPTTTATTAAPPPTSIVTSVVTVTVPPTTPVVNNGGGNSGGGNSGGGGGGGGVAAPTLKASASDIPNPCTGSASVTWSSTGLTSVNMSSTTGETANLGPSGTQSFKVTCGGTTNFKFTGSNGGGSANATVTINSP